LISTWVAILVFRGSKLRHSCGKFSRIAFHLGQQHPLGFSSETPENLKNPSKIPGVLLILGGIVGQWKKKSGKRTLPFCHLVNLT
jgi:hypothetical protein